jgi:hypothetical protein
MIRFKKDETPTAAAPALVKGEAAKAPTDAVSATKAQRQKTLKVKEGGPKSAELFLPAEEQEAD